ncbi:MAG: DMT family transporter [Alphaproteobacteria bacterium]|nr:DMT family transporter [Alphaproteobacteria bacterium]
MSDRPGRASPPVWLPAAPILFLLLWSGGFTFAKLGIAHAEPITFLALRYACVLVVLAPLFLILRPRLPSRLVEWGHLAVVGVLIQAAYFGLSYIAFDLGVSAGVAALVISLQPILVGLLAPMLAGERVSALRWLGLVLGLAGAAVVILARMGLEPASVPGLLAAAGAMLAMTGATLYEKRYGGDHHPVSANLVQYAAGLVVVLPIAAIFETMTVDWTAEFGIALAYLVIGNSLIAVTLLLAMLRFGEAARVSALLFLVPPTASLIAWGMLGEAMPALAWAGMALAAVGVLIARR